MSIIINNETIRIRPSAINTFYGCAYQWGKTFLEGVSSIPNSRAAIGTAIHKGIEVSWQEAMRAGKAEHNLSMMTDAAMEAWKEEEQKGMRFGDDETASTCASEIIKGMEAWKDELAPFIPIPEATEVFLKIDITNHPLVSEVGGTLDYLGHGCLDDVKTSKRKVTAGSYDTQQGTYKYLAEAHGHVIKHNRLQNVVLTKSPSAQLIEIVPDVEKAKGLINGMLDTLRFVAQDVVPIEVLLRGNPQYMFCSEKYCAHYETCPWVKGTAKEPRRADIAKIKL